MEPRKWRRLRARAYEIVETGVKHDLWSRLFDYAIGALIVVNAVVVSLETIQPLDTQYSGFFIGFEVFSVGVFLAEYIVRVWTSIENPRYDRHKPVRSRLRYAVTFYAIVDLLAVLPSLLAFFIWPELRVLRVFRLIRLLKLGRYSTAITTLSRVLFDERRALVAAFGIMIGLATFSACLIYFIERTAQPEAFGSVPDALWWALATLTTVGYGDVVPITAAGKIIGSMTMIFGIGVYALPIGIIASGFAREIHRREFVITWDMVARVPLFSDLSAAEVGQIAALLRSRVVESGSIIARKGDPAHSMYFIISGKVEVMIDPEPVQLHEGDFFGEIALLHKTRRSATAIAQTKARLMVLDAGDFHHLIEINPTIRDSVKHVAEQRAEFRKRGDIAAEELE